MFSRVFYLFIPLVLSAKKIEVKVSQGKIMGSREATVFEGRLYNAFYGVPYAQPPVGKLRFKNPLAPKKWERPFDASTEYHGACAQAHIVHKNAVYGVEDCLHLNIYTPQIFLQSDEGKLRAVVVWIHGYAFTSSFSHIHGADFLIDNDVVFVTVTHRVGVFGFLKLNESDSDANMGLKDIVMALKWIKKNIKQFGGDKNKVTVMGSGSAATFLSLLFMSKSRNLFSKMILQSGSIFSPSILQNNYDLERDRLKTELKKKGIQDIMTASTKDIIMVVREIYNHKEMVNFQRPLVPFTLVLEEMSNKSLITQKPDEFYKMTDKEYLDMPILIGFNSQESISEVIPFLHNPRYLRTFTSIFKFMVPFDNGCSFNYTSKEYKLISEKIKSKYFKEGLTEKAINDFLRYVSDLHKYPIYKFIKTHLNTFNSKMFVYKFDYVGKFNAVKGTAMAGTNVKVKGAASGDEVCYLLKCEPLWETYVNVTKNPNDKDEIFIKDIAKMWANFAKYGDPTHPKSFKVAWLPMSLAEDRMLHIGRNMKLINPKSEEKMYDFWNDIYNTYYSSEHCVKDKHDEL